LLDLSDSTSLGSNEKRATSEPEIKADKIKRTTKTRSAVSVSNVNGRNSIFPNKASEGG
jgi:hypothetical protein